MAIRGICFLSLSHIDGKVLFALLTASRFSGKLSMCLFRKGIFKHFEHPKLGV